MKIRRVLALCLAVMLLGGGSPALFAQNVNKKEQEKRTKQEQADIDALLKMVDGVSAGQPAPADVAITWESNHFVKSGDGSTYIPFTLAIDRSKLTAPGVAMYIRAVRKGQAAAPAAAEKKGDKAPERVTYPWDNVYFADVKSDGKMSRAVALPGGDYEIFIGLKEKTTGQKNQPPAKMGLLRQSLTVPDFKKPELVTSSILMGNVESIEAPLNPAQQQENPYTFGTMKVVPSADAKISKTGELSLVFWIYGATNDPATNKPNVTVEYSFHQKLPDGEKSFNKTAPQDLNATTLPPQFDLAAGHQLPGSLSVPLASFPPGDYRLEIKITDKAASKSTTQNVNFSVLAS